MRRSLLAIPDFSRSFADAAGRGNLLAAPAKPVPVVQPDKEIRRINSAHQPEVRDVASDNALGGAIVEADARELAVQKKTVRRQQRRQQRD